MSKGACRTSGNTIMFDNFGNAGKFDNETTENQIKGSVTLSAINRQYTITASFENLDLTSFVPVFFSLKTLIFVGMSLLFNQF
jgi:hypothetical protein